MNEQTVPIGVVAREIGRSPRTLLRWCMDEGGKKIDKSLVVVSSKHGPGGGVRLKSGPTLDAWKRKTVLLKKNDDFFKFIELLSAKRMSDRVLGAIWEIPDIQMREKMIKQLGAASRNLTAAHGGIISEKRRQASTKTN